MRRLFLRIVDDGTGPEPDRTDHRLVIPGGSGSRSDHAGDRGARRVELRQVRTAACLRAGRRRRRHRGGARAADRRRVHHLRSWRWVFVGEVFIVVVILLLARRENDAPAAEGVRLDLVGTGLSALGLTLIVLGIRSGPWGFVQPKPDAPEWLGLSPVIWLILGGGAVLALFMAWENRRIARVEGALIDPALLHNLQLRSGVTSYLFMYLVQGGRFFVVPLFLSVALGLSAIETGVRLLPLSLTLMLFAIGIPKLRPDASPRRVISAGFVALFTGLVVLTALLEVGAGPEIVTWPLLLAGSGLGGMASQLGSVTVSAVPNEQSGEVGGLQNTGTQLGASIGTALAWPSFLPPDTGVTLLVNVQTVRAGRC